MGGGDSTCVIAPVTGSRWTRTVLRPVCRPFCVMVEVFGVVDEDEEGRIAKGESCMAATSDEVGLWDSFVVVVG